MYSGGFNKSLLVAIGAPLALAGVPIYLASRDQNPGQWLGWACVPVAIAIVAVWIVAARQRLHRIEDMEIQRFNAQPRVDDATFLSQLGLNSESPEAAKAICVRRVLAELGCVPTESIAAFDRFDPDFMKLPFYDSIDVLHIVFTLEKELQVKINWHAAVNQLDRFLDATVGEYTLAIVHATDS